MATPAERFEALVDRTGPHHRWLGATDQRGIPQIRVDGRLTTARRVAWELHHGALPHRARVQACAHDPSCVRVEHLTITQPPASPPRTTRIRRPRGDGSMREIRPGVWKLTITTDSHRRASRTIRGDHDKASLELTRMAARHGRPPATVDALVTAHLAHLADSERSPSTLRRYEQLWRTWLAPALGEVDPD